MATQADVILESVKEFQQKMKDAGLYTGDIDGDIGPQTMRAYIAFLAKSTPPPPPPQEGSVWPQAGNRTMTVDISYPYQADVNWDTLKSVPLVCFKSTEGNTWQDKLSKTRHGIAKQHNILTQYYHFFHPKDDVRSQLDNMFSYTGPMISGDLPPALDVEWTDNLESITLEKGSKIPTQEYVEKTLQMLELMEEKYGVVPWLYTNYYFFIGMKNPERFSKYPLWLNNVTTHLLLPAGFSKCTSLQFTDKENVPGIGPCDASWFNGSLDELKALAKT